MRPNSATVAATRCSSCAAFEHVGRDGEGAAPGRPHPLGGRLEVGLGAGRDTTSAPASARATAMPAPMPLPAPVTTATRSVSLNWSRITAGQ